MRRFGNYSVRDIVVLAAIAGLFIWFYGGQGGFGTPFELLITIPALVAAVTFHEFAHAFVALRLGDATAKMLGRVSLNPIRHLDLFGSIAFFIFHFGWGKPVPINPYNMRGVSPLVGAAISAIAGPVSNVLLAILLTIPFHLGLLSAGIACTRPTSIEALATCAAINVNVTLAAFNFLPIPPLDGFSLARLVLPRPVSAVLEQYGMFILIALVFLPQFLGRQFDVLSTVMRPLLRLVHDLVFFGM